LSLYEIFKTLHVSALIGHPQVLNIVFNKRRKEKEMVFTSKQENNKGQEHGRQRDEGA
jgi:hypothetical protein